MKDFTWQKRKFVLYCMIYNYIYNFYLFGRTIRYANHRLFGKKRQDIS